MTVKKRAIALFAILICVFVGAYCFLTFAYATTSLSEQRKVEKVDTMYFEAIGGANVMPVGGFWGPFEKDPGNPYGADFVDGAIMPNFISDEYFELLQAAGINTFLANGSYELDETLLMLDYAEKYNMGAFVLDTRVAGWAQGVPGVSEQKMKTELSPFINHPACLGVYVQDEPWYDWLANMHGVYDTFYNACGGFEGRQLASTLVGHNTSRPNASATKAYSFKEELNEFITQCNPNFVLVDKYVFTDGRVQGSEFGGDFSTYFAVLSNVNKACKEKGIPFWMIMQSGGSWDTSDTAIEPNESEFMWNLNTSLAYGAKGIMYFPLFQPYDFSQRRTGTDYNISGLFGADGCINQWYYYALKAGKQIGVIDEILMNAQNMGIMVNLSSRSEQSLFLNKPEVLNKFRELKAIEGDAMVGCFDYLGKTALYVVNFSRTNKQSINLKFDGKYGYDVIQRGEKAGVSGKDTLTLTLEAGEGALVTIR